MDYQTPSGGLYRLSRTLEWAFGATAAVLAAAVALFFAYQQVRLALPPGEDWNLLFLFPMPGLYLLEILLLGLFGLFLVWRSGQPQPAGKQAARLLWATAGILLAFVILGGLSIGPFLAPSTLLVALAGLLAGLRHRINMVAALGLAVLAALVQAGLMWLVLNLFPNA